MKSLRRALIALGISAALGGASGSAKAQQPPPGGAEIAVQGTYFHGITKLEFPEAIGPFSRKTVRRWDSEGLNVSGHYRLGDPLRAIATVYQYPGIADDSDRTNEAIAQHFRSVQQDVTFETPSFHRLAEAPYRATINGFAIRGFKAVYQAPALFDSTSPWIPQPTYSRSDPGSSSSGSPTRVGSRLSWNRWKSSSSLLSAGRFHLRPCVGPNASASAWLNRLS